MVIASRRREYLHADKLVKRYGKRTVANGGSYTTRGDCQVARTEWCRKNSMLYDNRTCCFMKGHVP